MRKVNFVGLTMAFVAMSGDILADNSMDGTYMAELASSPLTMHLPARVYLVVNGNDAVFLMQGPDGEERLPTKVGVEGNRLLLGGKTTRKPLVFYRRLGDPRVLDCLKCQGEGLPSVWVRVDRHR